MPDSYIQQATFNKGEISPKLHARIDSDIYAAGLMECENFHVLVQGGVSKRSGTLYCGNSIMDKTTDHSHFLPFVFSDTQAYVLEFGNQTMALIKDGGLIMNGPNRYQIPTPYLVADLPGLSFVQSADVLYLVHRSYPTQKLARFAELDWRLTPLVLKNGPWLDVNVKDNAVTPTGLAKPAVTATVNGLSAPAIIDGDMDTDVSIQGVYGATSGNVLFTMGVATPCAGYTVSSIQSAGDTNNVEAPYTAPRTWSFGGSDDNVKWVTLDRRAAEADWLRGEERAYTFTNDHAYKYYKLSVEKANGSRYGCQIAEMRLYLKGKAGTITFQNLLGLNAGAGLTSADNGRQMRWQGADGYWRIFTITGVSSTTAAAGTWEGFWSFGVAASQAWSLSAFSKPSGYPGAVALYQSRLCFGGTTGQPRTVYMSASADFENFALPDPLTDDAPITITLAGQRYDAMDWLLEVEDMLMIGTSDGLVSLSGTENNIISPTNVRQRRHTGFGSAKNTHPARVGAVVIFIGTHGDTSHELLYSAQANGYDAPNLAIMADHLYVPKLTDIAFCKSLLDTAYMVSNDGSLIAMTYESAQKVVGHSPFRFKGGKVKSQAVIPENGADTLYLLMERTIDGTLRHYVERVQPFFNYGTDANAWFLDCALRYVGPSTTTITGLGYLEGQTVQVFQGSYGNSPFSVEPSGDPTIEYVVRNGQITLSLAVTDAVIGIPLSAHIKLLQNPTPTDDGSSYGRLSTTDGVVVALLNTRAVKVRAAEGLPSDPLVLRKGEDPMNLQVPLFTGTVNIPIDSSWMTPDTLEVISDTPHPCTILSITSMIDREPGGSRRQGG